MIVSDCSVAISWACRLIVICRVYPIISWAELMTTIGRAELVIIVSWAELVIIRVYPISWAELGFTPLVRQS